MKFTIAILPSGKMIVATENELTEEQMKQAIDLTEEWMHNEENKVLVFAQTRVVLVEDVEFQLPQHSLPH